MGRCVCLQVFMICPPDVTYSAMGKTLSEDEKSKKPWDSNAITPGTPFMDILSASLRYWVVNKMNTDPGWADVSVVLGYRKIVLTRFLCCSCKSSFPTLASRVRANTRSWTGFGASGATLVMTPTPGM